MVTFPPIQVYLVEDQERELVRFRWLIWGALTTLAIVALLSSQEVDPPLIADAQNGDIALVRTLLGQGVDVNTTDSLNLSTLNWSGGATSSACPRGRHGSR